MLNLKLLQIAQTHRSHLSGTISSGMWRRKLDALTAFSPNASL
jgi:hypothetical protein